MMSYEQFIKKYVENNKDVLNRRATEKKRLLKFSEAVSRAISESKKSDTGYGDLAESLASAGLSDSGYADYLRDLTQEKLKDTIIDAENEKALGEAEDDLKFREEAEKAEAERLALEEEERIKAEKDIKAAEKEMKAAEKEIQKLKKTVSSFASANNVVDYSLLYDYAVGIGLSDADAKSVSEMSIKNVKEKLRQKNIEKSREVIISERLTKDQAYSYAINIGLSEEDALLLAEFAYKMNQAADRIIGD